MAVFERADLGRGSERLAQNLNPIIILLIIGTWTLVVESVTNNLSLTGLSIRKKTIHINVFFRNDK